MVIGYVKDDYFSQAEFLYGLSAEDNEKRELLTNLIVIDVVTNMEVYVERLLSQFLKKYNEVGVPTSKIENKLKIEHTKTVMSSLQTLITHEHKQEDTISLLKKVSRLWVDDSEDVMPIEVGVKFPRGKHGEVQLESLFEKMNIRNVLDKVEIDAISESLVDESKLDIGEFIRDITSKRNIAIHEGAPLHFRVSLENLRFLIDTTDELLNQLTALVNCELNRHRQLLAS